MTELPFLWVLYWVTTPHHTVCFLNHIEQKWSFGVLFMVSNVNAYSEWIWIMETSITYYMYLFWHGRVWHHRSHHMDGKMISINVFFLKFVCCAIISYKNVPLQASMENGKGDPKLCKFPFYFNWCVLQQDSTMKRFLFILPHPNFVKNTITFDV